jgi:hypothetical protein
VTGKGVAVQVGQGKYTTCTLVHTSLPISLSLPFFHFIIKFNEWKLWVQLVLWILYTILITCKYHTCAVMGMVFVGTGMVWEMEIPTCSIPVTSPMDQNPPSPPNLCIPASHHLNMHIYSTNQCAPSMPPVLQFNGQTVLSDWPFGAKKPPSPAQSHQPHLPLPYRPPKTHPTGSYDMHCKMSASSTDGESTRLHI